MGEMFSIISDEEEEFDNLFGPDFDVMNDLPPEVNLISPRRVATEAFQTWKQYGKGYVDNTPANASVNRKTVTKTKIFSYLN